MFVVIIKRTSEQDESGRWTQCASYVVKGTRDAERAMYEALYRWVQGSYHGSVHECLKAMGHTSTIGVTVFLGDELSQLEKVRSYVLSPYTHWAGGRTINESPVHCAACDWFGSMKQMVHKYRLNSQQEIEPTDFCPACGALLI